jgi:hypothetical protein
MRVDKPLWLLVGGVSVVAERVAGAVSRRGDIDHPEPTAGADPAADEAAPITGTHVVLGSLAALARVGAAVGQQASRIVRRQEPTWNGALVSARGRVVVASLASRGEELERRSRAWASRYFDGQLDRFAGSRPVSAIVDAQLDRLLEPLVDRALPIVLDRLGQQREQVRAIVWEHGEDLTGELVAGIRDRAAMADTTAERMTRRLFGGRRDGSTPDEQTRDPVPPAGRGVRP